MDHEDSKVQKNIYFCLIDYANTFDHVDHNKLWKILWETFMWVKKQQLEPDMEQQTGSKLGNQYLKAVYCHPPYLTSMQNANLDETQARIKIAGRSINNLRYAPPLWQKVKRN